MDQSYVQQGNGSMDASMEKPLSLKKLADQVIVITGASSGIGLATARMAAARGARLVLAARNEHALKILANELKIMAVPPSGCGRMSAAKKM